MSPILSLPLHWLPLLCLAAPALDEPLFVDVTERALPDVLTTSGSTAKDYILEVNGGGLVVEDFDRDGNLDLVVIDGSNLARVAEGLAGMPPRFFLGDGEGGFGAAPEAWAMSGGRWGMGGSAGDLNGDGFPDLIVTQWGPDRVFLNEGGEGFRELEESGLIGSRWGTSAALLDFDGDGVLDLAVANYLAFEPGVVPPPGGGCTWKGHAVMCGPEGLVPLHDQLYRGIGDGSFVDASFEAGFVPELAGFALGVITLDYDLDGDTDLYVTNDSTPNHLWENQGDGSFAEVGYRRGVSHDANGKEQAGMGVASGDVDGDGRPDLLVTNFSGENNALYRSSRAKGFRERSSAAGLGGPSMRSLGWGTGLHDFDLDGELDVFVLNGHVYPQADRPGTDTSYAQRDQLFLGQGDGRFVEAPLADSPDLVSRAGVAFDMDGDGDLDLATIELDGAVHLFENRAAGGGHWLRVRLAGLAPNTLGVGASVSVVVGERTQRREIGTSAGFQAGAPAEAHFGLGAAERVDELRVTWPSGQETVLKDVAVDRLIQVEQESK